MQKKKKYYLKDIAKELGVSNTTVSFVINGKGKENKISDEVIERVLTFAEEVNFTPNSIAQSLRTGNTKTLVFMVEDISNHFFAQVARYFEDAAYEAGYKVLFCSNDNDDKKSKELIQMFLDRQVDGFVITPSPGIKKEIELIHDKGIPVILFDRKFDNASIPYVGIKNYETSFLATNHLIKNGYNKIGLISTHVEQTQMIDRLNGYKDAMKEAGLTPRILKVPFAPTHSQNLYDPILKFIDSGDELDCLFFTTNYLAQIGIRVLKKNLANNIQLGLMAFDDDDLFTLLDPTITAVKQPLSELSACLIEKMLRKLKGQELMKLHTELDADVIVRESTKKLS